MSSEKPDIIEIQAYTMPHGAKVKTVCVTGTKASDPFAIGSKGDRDTATCKVLNSIQHMALLKNEPANRH